MTLLNVNQAADRLGTSVRFVRRLVHERRIAYTKLGQHVRIEESDIDAFIAAGRVEPRVVNGRTEQLAWLSTDWSSHGDELLGRLEGETGT
jgi:excisionase family DNA binding protein